MSNGWQPSGPQTQQQGYNPYGAGQRPPASPYGGAPPAGPSGGAYPGAKPPNNGKAVASLILGIAGCCIISFLGGIPAIILGIMARKEIRESGGRQGGDGMALTGIILGSIATVVGIIYLIVLIAGIASAPWECLDNPDAPGCEDFAEAAVDGGAATMASEVPVAEPRWSIVRALGLDGSPLPSLAG